MPIRTLCYALMQMRRVEAEYRDGILKPDEPLKLRPGERVKLIVLREADAARWDLQKLSRGASEDRELAESGLGDWVDALDEEDRG